jgi:lipopolysaccharide/colanic/teichoic acid biosynthesis glycosyltransferase
VDLTFSSIALVLLAPIIIGAMIAIKVDSPGPVLFKQQRFGYKNTVFYIWKLRTMYVDLGDLTGAACTTRNDPSITRVGRWLRRTSIDELPQLFNVIRGEMSLVGPRAHPVAMRVNDKPYGAVVENYFKRHQVWPGITGWAQVNGLRGAIESIESASCRLDHDLEYIANWSLMLDFRILVRTALIVFRDENAF